MGKKDVERNFRHDTMTEIRKKNVTDYFLHMSRWHREWLTELTERYKQRGEFPMMPIQILPSYYTERNDVEIAAFVSLLIKSNAEITDVLALRGLFGASPWRWFVEREFVRLSIGDIQSEQTGGITNWKIAKMMSRLWDELYAINGCVDRTGIFDTIAYSVITLRTSYFDYLTYLLNDCSVGNYFYKLRLLLMVLGTSGGLGLGVLDLEAGELKCPYADGLRRFVSTWFPDYGRIMNIDDAISLFGLGCECDFLYAFLGYGELQKIDPKGCSLYATRYNSWYSFGSDMKRTHWISIQPEIPF